jgi:diguanylate cyclase (GGDEF)-like protein
MMMSLLPFLLGLAVTGGMLLPMLLRLRASARAIGARAQALESELVGLRRSRAQIEDDQRSLTQFLKDFPHLARDLFSGLTERQVPPSLLHLLQKSLDPAQAVVLVRRGADPGDARFVVVAATGEGGLPGIGTEVPLDRGELGFVAESQLVVGRDDLATGEVKSRIRPGPDVAGLQPDLIAPLVFDQQTLGMIALSRPRRAVGDGKAALRLISQTGAQALHAAATSSRPRVTAEMDGLTRVFNRRHMEQVLSEMVYRTACATYDRPGTGTTAASASLPLPGPGEASLSIFLFGIDHFEHYNDANGHLPGDKLLQELARCVQENVRKDDILGRFGNDEFLLVLPNTTLPQALGAVAKVRAAIAGRKFPFAERQPMGVISVSGGVAQYPHDGTDAPRLLQGAESALNEARRQGRNRVMAAALPARPAASAQPAAPVPAPAAPPAPAQLLASPQGKHA